MARMLYLGDSYMRECDATVVSAVEGKNVVLDRTVFYARGGGQPCDTGKLVTVPGLEFRVLNVVKKDGEILHELERPVQDPELKTGDRVRCIIDWDRRYRHMRMHTASHVLGATMYNDLGAMITGNQIEADKTRFDFSMEGFDRQAFEEVVKKANAALSQDTELKTYTLPREEAMKIPGVVKLANALPPAVTELRIVEIPGIDTQADGGTHVRNLKEVGQIELLKLENKGKINKRIYFTLKP